MTEGCPASSGPSRRRLLASFFWAAVALVTALIATPVLGYLVGPLFRRRPRLDIRIGEVEGLPLDRPERVDFVVRQRDGWVITGGRRTAWVVRRADGIQVFDPRCTHLGCAYHWDEANHQFICPCHGGVYDVRGRVVSGPPPRPLDTYATRVEAGVLYITPSPRRTA